MVLLYLGSTTLHLVCCGFLYDLHLFQISREDYTNPWVSEKMIWSIVKDCAVYIKQWWLFLLKDS